MGTVDRRTFLRMAGLPAAAAALPLDLSKALAIPANNRTGSIADVEHVIILMQENRSFDHYFGTLRGVRGFADPHPVRLPSGRSVWHQPAGADGKELLPFRPEVPDLGQTYLPDPPHGWNDGHAAWNNGRYDQWVPSKGVTTMTYHTRKDLPYQSALADAFTVCDNYHCSLLGPTDPNRYHMWSGWVGNDGRGGGPVINNAEAGYDWSTYPERLERNGVSWRVYQDIGDGLNTAGSWGWTRDPYIGNYGDNSLLYFHQYQNAAPGQPLADRAKRGTEVKALGRDPLALLSDFRADVEQGRLPSVSWIVAPEAYTEHPNWEPSYGAWYISQVIDILAAHPEVWSRMALFITYDEDGGFFDHLVPPTPPVSAAQGASTVPTTHEIYPGDPANGAGPYGLGVRVPMIVVSPWSRGGWVNSQLFDHTSLIRFLEARFAGGNADLVESNITPWRRAVTGDLTGAFDFRAPNRRPVRLPGTVEFQPEELVRHPDEPPVPPVDQQVPQQEPGVRPARALPYTLHADATADNNTLTVTFRNTGRAAAVFLARSAADGEEPRTYTVEPGKTLTGTWAAADGYDVAVHGPNGFHRAFGGAARDTEIDVTALDDSAGEKITLVLRNPGDRSAQVTVLDAYTGRQTRLTLRRGQSATRTWSTTRTRGWYDLTISGRTLRRQYAGHLENGRDSISDPAMGGLV
ncbi:phosphocholine-specific phospholipase C [Actinoplanes friuliensis]|uniref:phospholipase C n=1 Tax=Actinoplanes friuliensis DSM 7358 TaxID=1246995 RepID=U5VWE2_9ACTN|nr:phospholipase C, phosphocholine-specific [Actinoplanes friuliensis]AGZ41323.1 phospholipase C [Actinoplanes friuliensis DSM 7358]